MHRNFRPQLVARSAQLLLDIAVGWIQLDGGFVFDEGFVELRDGGEAAASRIMILRCAELRPFERNAGVDVVRIQADGSGVLHDGAVEVLPPFGVAALPEGG